MLLKKVFIGFIGLITVSTGFSQRSYQPHSVLSTGTWYKIAVKEEGVYKIDVPFLTSLGINTSNLPSSAIRLYGNGGNMLPEANAITRPDDLIENSIEVIDGGDGILNGADYLLFYATGPNNWKTDSVNKQFSHRKNLYSDKAYYFLTVGGQGKRVSAQLQVPSPITTITSFNNRFFYELDTVNFLSGGKEWYGEEFTNAPGKQLSRKFDLNIPGLQINEALTINTNVVARSANGASRFDISVNNQPIQQLTINATGTGVYDPFAIETTRSASFNVSQPNLSLNFSYVPGSFNAQGWLNWFEIFSRRQLSMANTNQLAFRDWRSAGSIAGEFVIANANNGLQVWDVTDPLSPIKMNGFLQGSDFRFINDCSRLKEYISFYAPANLVPEPIGKIANQDLHNTVPANYLVVTHPLLINEANRLAKFHQTKNNLSYAVVTTEQVFNEFSSGSQDPVAIRDFVKMYHDKYKATADTTKYLLLLGSASFDYKNRITNNTNLVPAYESSSSLDPLSSYTSDDFFGFLDDGEDINSGLIVNMLDIGIGRVPARNAEEAKNYVDKVQAYFDKESFGPWRNNLTFIADDEDFNLHLQDAEVITQTANATNDLFNRQKIYLDAYRQESGSGGSRYPLANNAINNQILNGTLLWNYNGHGGPRRLAEETILDQQIVNSWTNNYRLPLFITATCDFAPFDQPYQQSLGENILLRANTGGIALMTTTRVVFAFSNRLMNDNYIRFALEKKADKTYRSLGQSIRDAKNYTYQTSGDVTNNRKFALLGDPALTLAFPTLNVGITKMNNKPVSAITDTLKATDRVIIEGEVTDASGNVLNDFNGIVFPTVFDKVQTVTTLANDATSQPVGFETQTTVLYKGKATVTNGHFSFVFKMPKDINFRFDKGRLSLYANDVTTDASGLFTNFIVGGIGNNIGNDKEGPAIKAFLNDEKFVNGGISNANPVLIVKLSDSSGINTAGAGIGHDIIVTLDDDNRQFYVLNNFFEADLDSYQKGSIRFQLPPLEAGVHTLKIKAWDVVNNSNEIILEFTVAKDEELEIGHVLNYPNPFSTHTQFWFEHNKPGQNLDVRIQIFTMSGRLIKTIKQTINTTGNRSSELEWDGKDAYGDKVGRGVYIYQLRVTTAKKSKQTIEKLYIF